MTPSIDTRCFSTRFSFNSISRVRFHPKSDIDRGGAAKSVARLDANDYLSKPSSAVRCRYNCFTAPDPVGASSIINIEHVYDPADLWGQKLQVERCTQKEFANVFGDLYTLSMTRIRSSYKCCLPLRMIDTAAKTKQSPESSGI